MSSAVNGVSAWSTVRRELEQALALVHQQPIEALVDRFQRNSGRLFFSGQGRSGLVADMAAMRFMQLGARAHAVGEVTAPSLCASDVLVIVSGSGRTATSVQFARTARREEATIILLTRTEAGPIQDIADETVVIDMSTTVQFGNTLFEHVALLILDSVVLALMGELDDAGAVMHHNHTNLE